MSPDPTPVPRDIPLPLPVNGHALELLLIAAFIAHILFVNLMVGGSILVLAFEIRGAKNPDYDRLARALASTVTVNKSLAVVLGVAPLLLLNLLYTIHFYTANTLTGTAWILLIPTIATTFLLLYLHKYTWDRLRDLKWLHIGIQAMAVVLFLFIPLVFLTNVNLMMFPEHWTNVRGFLSALVLPNVFPRYFHFLCASLILTSLFGVGYFGRAKYPVEETFQALTRPQIRRAFYTVAFGVSLAQFIVGPLVLFTLPSKGLSGAVLSAIAMGALLAIPAIWMMWKDLSLPEPDGKRLPFIAGCLSLTVLCMATGRHVYRGVALAEHRQAMRLATERWAEESAQAAYEQTLGRERAAQGVTQGQALFQSTCSACHGVDRRVVGPPLTEIARIYADNPDGIVTWARAPGKKRVDYPQMPAFASLGDPKLRAIAAYMLQTGASKTAP
ncbi:c-type cytochrome [Pendulispora albinea]|uniref:Cytochrome c n=1 Tax=Pendulispora albinea TaxID=2741071 RepID=A0ABZ2M9H3_9BACT